MKEGRKKDITQRRDRKKTNRFEGIEEHGWKSKEKLVLIGTLTDKWIKKNR